MPLSRILGIAKKNTKEVLIKLLLVHFNNNGHNYKCYHHIDGNNCNTKLNLN